MRFVSHLSHLVSCHPCDCSVTCMGSQAGTDKVRTVKMVLTFCIPRIELKPQQRSLFCHKRQSCLNAQVNIYCVCFDVRHHCVLDTSQVVWRAGYTEKILPAIIPIAVAIPPIINTSMALLIGGTLTILPFA